MNCRFLIVYMFVINLSWLVDILLSVITIITMILRRNYPENQGELLPPPRAPLEPPAQDYQILLEFDIKREKEKNLILEERLKNKETFITQMKNFQEELTQAYESCKNELIIAKQQIQYLQNVEFREYTEQIADLKHMLMMKTQQSKRNSIGKEDKQIFGRIGRNRSDKYLSYKNSDRRQSKTSSNYATQRQRSASDRLQHEVSKELKKSANFISHFVQMAECYVAELKGESKLTKKLKKSWKWIKEVVKEWDNLRQTCKSSLKFREELAQMFDVDRDTAWGQYMELIRKASQRSP